MAGTVQRHGQPIDSNGPSTDGLEPFFVPGGSSGHVDEEITTQSVA